MYWCTHWCTHPHRVRARGLFIRQWISGGGMALSLGPKRPKQSFSHVSNLPHLCIGTHDLDYSDTVRYLGILLDGKFTLGPHIREKAKRAIRLLYRFRTLMGQMWGPSPFLMSWVLTGIVCPKVTYSAIVWAIKTTNYKHLGSVQRLGMLVMTHVCRSTPTAGLSWMWCCSICMHNE